MRHKKNRLIFLIIDQVIWARRCLTYLRYPIAHRLLAIWTYITFIYLSTARRASLDILFGPALYH